MLAQALTQQPPAPLAWLWPRYLPLARLTLLAADPGVVQTAASHSTSPPDSPPPPPCPPSLPPQTLPLPRRLPLHHPRPRPGRSPPSPPRPRQSRSYPHPLRPSQPPPHSSTPSTKISLALQASAPLKLLIIDPITAYLPLITPDAPLYRLADLARQFNLAILLTTRLAKNFALSPSHLRRSLGSLAFASAARCAHILLPARSARFLEPKNTPQSSTPPLPNGPSPIASPLTSPSSPPNPTADPSRHRSPSLSPPSSVGTPNPSTTPASATTRSPNTQNNSSSPSSPTAPNPPPACSMPPPKMPFPASPSPAPNPTSISTPPASRPPIRAPWPHPAGIGCSPMNPAPSPPDLPSASDTSLSQIMSLLTKP